MIVLVYLTTETNGIAQACEFQRTCCVSCDPLCCSVRDAKLDLVDRLSESKVQGITHLFKIVLCFFLNLERVHAVVSDRVGRVAPLTPLVQERNVLRKVIQVVWKIGRKVPALSETCADHSTCEISNADHHQYYAGTIAVIVSSTMYRPPAT